MEGDSLLVEPDSTTSATTSSTSTIALANVGADSDSTSLIPTPTITPESNGGHLVTGATSLSVTTTTSTSSTNGIEQNIIAESSTKDPLASPSSDAQHEIPAYNMEVDLLTSVSAGSKTWIYDPLSSPDWDAAGPPGNLCAGRVKKDLSTIFNEPLPGIFAIPEEENLFKVHCLIIGPFDTPYEGGFFHFIVRFGPQYPLHPPRVRLLTTGGNSVRFNPNLYKNGKVCLSILGTWSGPPWSPASNLSSVLLSLQSLMNEKPYHNEPGYEQERTMGDCERYNNIIMHETIRVAVIQQLMGLTTAPPELKRIMEASFIEYYDHYVDICEKNLHKDSQIMEDPFGEKRGRFCYKTLLKNLKLLKTQIENNGIPYLPMNPTSSSQLPTESDDVSSIISSLSEPDDAVIETVQELAESDNEP